jgi:hypothetical protein
MAKPENKKLKFLKEHPFEIIYSITLLILALEVAQTIHSNQTDIYYRDLQIRMLESDVQNYERYSLELDFNSSCQVLSTLYNCDPSKMREVTTGYIVNGRANNMLQTCQQNFMNPVLTAPECIKFCKECR